MSDIKFSKEQMEVINDLVIWSYKRGYTDAANVLQQTIIGINDNRTKKNMK